jgi:hypothetical protein
MYGFGGKWLPTDSPDQSVNLGSFFKWREIERLNIAPELAKRLKSLSACKAM